MAEQVMFLTQGGALPSLDLDQYQRRGWAGPYPLLTAAGVQELTSYFRQHIGDYAPASDLAHVSDVAQLARPWFKSMHMNRQLCADVALHPAVLERVRSVLGDDLVVWGFTIHDREVGQRHRWHVDIEHTLGAGVSVFVGLEGASSEASLTVLEGSHRLADPPQELRIDSEAAALAHAAGQPGGLGIASMPLAPGEFCMFHGRLWHSSLNLSAVKRTAALIQYSAAGTPIRIPTGATQPVRWLSGTPPYFLVRGGAAARVDGTRPASWLGRLKNMLSAERRSA
jgi:hypothetical protein